MTNWTQLTIATQSMAEQGDPRAQTKLGSMYIYGRGVPQNCVLAYMWWTLGMAGGNELARNRRCIAATQMTPAEIAQAQTLTRAWKPKSSQ